MLLTFGFQITTRRFFSFHIKLTYSAVPDAIWHVVRVGGGWGVLDLNEPEVDGLLCQWGGFAPYWGPRGALIQYSICKKTKVP